MKVVVAALILAAGASAASAQAINSFTGGTQFFGFYGGAIAGDVVGWRFTVNTPITVTHLGVWNADTNGLGAGLTANHRIGIWDTNTQGLLTSTSAGPGGTVVGAWTYASTNSVNLVPGVNYTIGAEYNAGGGDDGDNYVSSPSSVNLNSAVNLLQGVFPAATDLGFVFPTGNTANLGRHGPNFLFVPAPGAAALLGLGGLAAARRRR